MIYDEIKNYEQYSYLGKRMMAGLEFLSTADPATIELGRHDIIPGEVYCNVTEYDLNEASSYKLEAHKKFADIQFVLSGDEDFGVAFTDECEPISEYDEVKDVVFLKGDMKAISLKNRKFAIVFPQDAHAPKIPTGQTHNKKAVVKVLL